MSARFPSNSHRAVPAGTLTTLNVAASHWTQQYPISTELLERLAGGLLQRFKGGRREFQVYHRQGICSLLRAQDSSQGTKCGLSGVWNQVKCRNCLLRSTPNSYVRQCRRSGFNPWVRKIPWRRSWQPTPVFLPGESSWT